MRMRGRPKHPDVLTPRRWDVLALLRRGLANEEIARELNISADGVKYHVSDILSRLGVANHYEATRVATEPPGRAWFATLRAWLALTSKATTHAKVASAAAVVATVVGVAMLAWTVGWRHGAGGPTLQQRILDGTAVAYHVVSRQTQIPDGPLRRTWTVGVYDAQEGRQTASFEVGDTDEWPTQSAVAGDDIVFNMGTKVVAYRYDGTGRRTVHAAPVGGIILGIATSPDGTRLALAEMVEDACPVVNQRCRSFLEVTRVKVIDLRTGEGRFDIGSDNTNFAAFPGYPQFVTWRADSRGIVVEGRTGDESPAVFATVMLDGSIAAEDSRGFWLKISPSGEATLHTPEEICSGLDLSTERHELRVTELITGRQLAALSDETLSFMPRAWSPDGRELMYETYTVVPREGRPGCTDIDPAAVRWYTLDLATGTSAEALSRSSIEQRWYGVALEFRCHGASVQEAFCVGDGHEDPLDLYAEGAKLASGSEFAVIGSAPRW